jgi:hypothetical protein
MVKDRIWPVRASCTNGYPDPKPSANQPTEHVAVFWRPVVLMVRENSHFIGHFGHQ